MSSYELLQMYDIYWHFRDICVVCTCMTITHSVDIVVGAVVPILMSLAPCNTKTSISGITNQKCNVAPDFDDFDLMNAMLPFTMPLALCDTNTGVAIYMQKCCIYMPI